MKWNVDVIAKVTWFLKKTTLEKDIGLESPQNNFICFQVSNGRGDIKGGYLRCDYFIVLKLKTGGEIRKWRQAEGLRKLEFFHLH